MTILIGRIAVTAALLLMLTNSAPGDTNMNAKPNRTDWFKDAKWGVFTHYLTATDTSVEQWNRLIDEFDVPALAKQLESVGAKYYFITIGQNSGHYCAPNATYDRIVGTKPSKCSRRDLVSDLYDALHPKGIKLMVYLPSGAPDKDPIAMEKLKWESGVWGSTNNKRLAEFQVMWQDIIRDWSLRWGNKVCGWWIDGCYFSDAMYRSADPPNFKTFADALRAGNPDAIVAFNPGVTTPVIALTDYEDYTAGEISDAFPVCPGLRVNQAQYHILSYLGENWSRGKPRFADEFVVGYTKDVTNKGGVVTWDVPTDLKGHIPDEYVHQLKLLGRNVK
jgi:hypothetical protein